MTQKLAGLVSLTEDPIITGRRAPTRRRAAPEPIEARSLQPQAAPVSTYVRPEQPSDAGADAMELAASLRSFSPVINEAFANLEAKQVGTAEAAAASLTPDQMQQYVRNGTVPATVTGAGRAAFNKLGAQQLALNRLSSLQSDWDSGTFDRDNGDFDAYIASKAQEDLASIKDPEGQAIYGSVLNKFSPKLRAQANDYRVAQVKGKSLAMVGDTWFAAVQQGIAEGKKPEEIQGALRGQYGKLKDELGLSPQELDGVLLGVTRRLSESPNTEAYVEHFLNDTRGGVGSIAAKQDTGPAAQVIINRAQASTKAYNTEQLRLQNKANADRDENAVTAGVEIAAENGALAFMVPREVRTESGGTKTVSADDQQKQGVEMIRQKAEKMATDGNPEGGMNYRLVALSKNGLVDDQFKSILKAGPSSATQEALAKGQVSPALKAGADLYETLYARNPRLLAQHVSDKDQFFYEAYRTARQDMGYDEAGAFQTAMRFTDVANPQDMPASQKQDFYKLRGAVDQLRAGSSWLNPFTWGDGEALTITDDTARKMEQWGEFYIRLGKSPDEALDLAKERIRAGSTVVHGNPVPTTDRTMPPNFKELAEWKLQQWAAKYGERYGLDASDLTVEPQNNGQQGVWTITRSDGNGPVMVMEPDEKAGLTFSLRGASAEREDAAKADVLEQHKANQTRRRGARKAGWEEGGLQ